MHPPRGACETVKLCDSDHFDQGHDSTLQRLPTIRVFNTARRSILPQGMDRLVAFRTIEPCPPEISLLVLD
jgi:hypothetical protein